MRYVRSALLALSLGLLATAAQAADLGGMPRGMKDAPPPPYAPVYTWTGLYIGTHAGYAWSDADWQDAIGSSSHDGSGWLAGGQIGYNLQAGRMVFGVEADISSAWVDGSTACAGGGGCSHSYNWIGSVRGRLGTTVNGDRTLLYVTGGGAWADIDYASTVGTGFSKTHSGWVLGGGIEHMLSRNLTARVEYLYYDLGDVTAPAGTLAASATSLDAVTQTVRFGLNLKF